MGRKIPQMECRNSEKATVLVVIIRRRQLKVYSGFKIPLMLCVKLQGISDPFKFCNLWRGHSGCQMLACSTS